MSEIVSELLRAAREAAKHAYAPYSNFGVGAAALDGDGRIWTGANVENASYPVGICAERVAIAKMASAGSRQLEMIAIATADGSSPCGMCLQAMMEFTRNPKNVRIILGDSDGKVVEYSLETLLPHGFRPRP